MDLAHENLRIDNDAVGDDRYDLGGEDAAGQEVKCVLLIADDHRVAGVVAPLVAHHVVNAFAEQVGGFALALVSPLGTHEHDRWHGLVLR